MRGGNSRHTRNLRYLHRSGNEYVSGAYPEEEFWNDLLRVTRGRTNEHLARMVIRRSADLPAWMESQGCRFQKPLRGTLGLSRTNIFFRGGGKALMNAWYTRALDLGVQVSYDTEVLDVELDRGRCHAVRVRDGQGERRLTTKALVLASGGFQANIPWLKEYWGDAAENFIIRGTPFNQGRMLRVMLDKGAGSAGDPRQCHAVAIDARAPVFDGGIVSRLDCVPFGIVVNAEARRFYDEGEDIWPKRYAIWGRLVADQPGQTAWVIVDHKAISLFMPSLFPPHEAGSPAELAEILGLDGAELEKTVAAFNQAVQPGSFNGDAPDGCRTRDLTPPKSNWARTLDTPPYYAWPLRPGITFTYLGLKVDDRARVLVGDEPAANIYAAGEIMAGNILGQGYMGGLGMTIGAVFGRIAGEEAAGCV